MENTSVFVEEQEKVKDYIETYYSERVPPPDKPNVTFWNLVGLKTIFFSISALGAIIFSAIRTGGYFYLVEMVLLSRFDIPEQAKNILATAAFLAALFAFEGFALADGFSKGERMNGVKESNFGLWASFVTITIIGIFSGLEIATIEDGLRNNLSIVAAIITSVSAASIAFFGGKNLGYAVGEFNKKKTSILEEHQKSYNQWREGAFRSYSSTMGSVKNRVQTFVQNEQSFEQKNEQDSNNVQDVFNQPEKMTASERATEFLNKYVQKERAIPTADLIKEKTGVAKGTASNATMDYIYQNASPLLQDGIVDESRVETATASYNKRNSK